MRALLTCVACVVATLGFSAGHLARAQQPVGAVFTMTNAFDASVGNEVVMYARSAQGTLDWVGNFATGGQGTGPAPAPLAFLAADPLGSQGSMRLTPGHSHLLVVNGGSDDVSVFRVKQGELELEDLEPSGGNYPVGLAVRGQVVYTLNAGGDGSIAGFRLQPGSGDLTPIPGSIRSLGLGLTHPPFVPAGPGMIDFSPDGRFLIVTVKQAPAGPGLILVYPLDNQKLPETPLIHVGNAEAPFGFAYSNQGHLIVSEPLGNGTLANVTSASAVSTYDLQPDGTLQLISPSVPNQLGGACWVVSIGSFAYVTNTATHNISAYQVAADGTLSLAAVGPFDTGDPAVPSFNLDLASTPNGKYLYVLEPGSGGVSSWRVSSQTGELQRIDMDAGLRPFVGDPLPTVPFSDLTGSPAGLAVY